MAGCRGNHGRETGNNHESERVSGTANTGEDTPSLGEGVEDLPGESLVDETITTDSPWQFKHNDGDQSHVRIRTVSSESVATPTRVTVCLLRTKRLISVVDN